MVNHKEIRILFAQDNETDFNMAVHELRSAGLEFISKRVEKRVDFERALISFNPEIIISDYTLPDFNGLILLDALYEKNLQIPVIIIAGSISEETAVNCMKAGASDYVPKDQYIRLCNSIDEILEKRQIRKAWMATEAVLRQSEARFSSILNNISNIAVQGYAPDGTIKYWNKASEKLYQYSTEEAMGKNLFDLIIPDELLEYAKNGVKRMFETGQAHPGEELRLKRKDGSYVYVFSSHAVYKLTDEEAELYCIDLDLTERIKAENALLESENRYRRLVENSLIGIFQSRPDGQFLFVNEALSSMLEFDSLEEILVTPADHLYLHPEDKTELLKSVSERKSVCDFETILLTKNGHRKDVIINASVEGNSISGMILDITGRKAAEREMIRAKEIAEESDRLKSTFLANLSHEVRTPMNGIVGFAELLFEKNLDEETKLSFVETIHQNSYQLLKIITDIIEISKIETEQLTVNYREFSLKHLMNKLEKKYSDLAKKKSVSIHFPLNCKEFDFDIISDEDKINQIFTHLLDNAIKFTESGSIEVLCEMNDLSLEFSIKDTGIGVKQGYEKLIFEPFRQVEDALNRKHGGNGLGLSIAKAYIESLGGKIWLKPNPEGGSVFVFSLPVRCKLPESGTPCVDQSEYPDYSKYTFLIAEDEFTNLTYLKKLLIPTGASLLYATTGRQAIEITESNPAINLVFMDIKMPEIDGLEATRIIKKHKPYLPVVATTAYVMTGDREVCISAGCDGYIAKPIRKAELFRILRKIII
ncbi:MAG: response regulator [Bacteroidota bacterium]